MRGEAFPLCDILQPSATEFRSQPNEASPPRFPSGAADIPDSINSGVDVIRGSAGADFISGDIAIAITTLMQGAWGNGTLNTEGRQLLNAEYPTWQQ